MGAKDEPIEGKEPRKKKIRGKTEKITLQEKRS